MFAIGWNIMDRWQSGTIPPICQKVEPHLHNVLLSVFSGLPEGLFLSSRTAGLSSQRSNNEVGTHARIHPIAEGITEKIEGKDRSHYRKGRKDHQMR
jgi:hypothetical protein